MKLESNKVKLSLLDESDLPLFIEMSTCPQLMKRIYKPFTVEEAKTAFYERSKPWKFECEQWLCFGIADISTGEKLGNIGLKIVNLEKKMAEVGFMLKTSAQGKGIASEALKLLINYAFCDVKINKLVAYCSTDNVASFQLLERVGFTREDCLKQNTMINNKCVDDYVYGLGINSSTSYSCC
jgi:RimJ/RimL family protein N-acetyltransferase